MLPPVALGTAATGTGCSPAKVTAAGFQKGLWLVGCRTERIGTALPSVSGVTGIASSSVKVALSGPTRGEDTTASCSVLSLNTEHRLPWLPGLHAWHAPLALPLCAERKCLTAPSRPCIRTQTCQLRVDEGRVLSMLSRQKQSKGRCRSASGISLHECALTRLDCHC